MQFDVDDQQLHWLVDTGASISAVKLSTLERCNLPYHIEKIRVNGIGGYVVSKGFVYLNLCSNGEIFEQRFYVFDNLPCESDGILGQDFFSNYSCILNYENNTLSLKTDLGEDIILNFNSSNDFGKYILVPARSESIHVISTSIEDECVIHSQELCSGVFIGNTIAQPKNGKVPVRLLNTRENDVRLSYFCLQLTKLSDYDICNFEKTSINSERVKILFENLDLKKLNYEEKQSIESICAKFPDVFQLPGDKLTTTKSYEQTINLKPNTSPVYTKPYRLPHSQKEEINKQIGKMLQDDIIEETRSAWSSPLLLVPKKFDATGEKKWRIVIDYRKINQHLEDDKFPLPNITEILDALSGAVYFTHLDLSQGYYQVLLEPNSRKCTAFTTSTGQYQMKRLPMGLKTSPSAFSRMMTVAMSGLTYEKCFVYLDDLIVFGRNLDQHNQNLLDVFSRLRKVNLKLNPAKCVFLQKEILYLGHVVSENGISPDPEKIRVLENYPHPINADEVKRFVAFCNYYRKFIPNFAKIAHPLNHLSRKDVQFIWSDECEKSFQLLKESMTTSPVLQYPNFSSENEFILKTDASGISVGAVLCNSDNRPIAYASRTLNKAEKNYPTIEKELLAIVWSVKYFRPYLFARHFKIQTDHKPLVYLFNIRDPSSRLLKFRLCLEQYDFEIEYVKGCNNVAADALSRVRVTSEDLKEMCEKVICVTTRAQARLQQDMEQAVSGSEDTQEYTDSRTDHPRVVEVIKKPRSLTELILDSDKKELLRILQSDTSIKDKNYVYVPSLNTIYMKPDTQSLHTRDVLVREFGLFCKKLNIKELCILLTNKNKDLAQGFIHIIRNSKSGPGHVY